MWCCLSSQPMVLMRGGSWNDLGSLLGGAGYTNCSTLPQYEGKESPSHGKIASFSPKPAAPAFGTTAFCHLEPPHPSDVSLSCVLETGSETEEGLSDENALTRSETTPTPSGPSGLVIFGRLAQKHSYVSGLIIMMVRISISKSTLWKWLLKTVNKCFEGDGGAQVVECSCIVDMTEVWQNDINKKLRLAPEKVETMIKCVQVHNKIEKSTCSGVEHHLQQLADLRSAGVVLHHLDDAWPPPLRHDVGPFPGHLRHRPGGAGLPERPEARPGRAVSRSASCCDRWLWPEQLPPCPVRPPRGEGESDNLGRRERDASVWNDLPCVPQVFYTFSFWLMFRQQLVERKEEQLRREESLDEVKVVTCNELSVARVRVPGQKPSAPLSC